MTTILCPLCNSNARLFFTDDKTAARHYHCGRCDLRFLDPTQRLAPADELERYRLHKNDLEAPDYQQFVSPLVNWIVERHPRGALGLDFGCGTAPILAHMLSRAGMEMRKFDVFFANDPSVLPTFAQASQVIAPLQSHASPDGQPIYDFIAASEVAEHFYTPAEELLRLKSFLRPGGDLALMTLLVPDEVNYETWHYRRDPTHVVFYSRETFEWIRREFGFSSLEIRGDRCIMLSR